MIRDAIMVVAEEDYYGLWEAVWRLRSMLPQTGELELRSIAKRTMQELLGNGKVKLFRRSGTGGKEELISNEEAYAILTSDHVWNEPLDGKSIQILFGVP